MESLKVLLVDDEEDFVFTLAERLELRGIQAFTATSGDEALQLVEAESPPVVVLDVKMPGISGVEVLKQIKTSYPHIQIILLTGHGSTQDGIRGMRLGAFDYMMKPVEIDELIDRMVEALKASTE